MTRTGKSVRLAGHRPEPLVELHAGDAALRGVADGDILEVESDWGRAVLRAHLSPTVRPGEAFAPMHWTAQVSRAGCVNSAVNAAVDPLSGQPELKHTPVEIHALDMRWHGTILARRPVMLPQIAYWTRIKGHGHHAYIVAGDQPIAAARQALSAALRSSNPGPWIVGEAGVGAVVGHCPLVGGMARAEERDVGLRRRLAPLLGLGRASVDERGPLFLGGD